MASSGHSHQLAGKAPLREGCAREEAVDTVWIVMDPAVFDRLTRQRRWTLPQYQQWFARSVDRLLLGDTIASNPTAIAGRRST